MNLGPQAQRTTKAAKDWAARASIVKQIGSTELFASAPDSAWRIFRWRFTSQDLNDAAGAFNQIVSALNGYRHPKLLVEVYNELPKETTAAQIAFYQKIVPMFTAIEIKVIGPCWGSGDYGLNEWVMFREAGWCGFFGIALHAYWADAGFTIFNATRWRSYYDPLLDAHPVDSGLAGRLVFVTECGRDKVNDGYRGASIGKGGYVADGLSVEAYASEVNAYGAQLEPDEFATPFTCGPEASWTDYDMDPVAPFIHAEVSPVPNPTPAPAPTFDVGPGVLALMKTHGDTPASDENYVNNAKGFVFKSETYGHKGKYEWNKQANVTTFFPFS